VRKLVRGVVAVGAPEGVVSAEVVAAFEQCAALLREELRGVEERAAVVELVLGVRRLGGEGQRIFLGGLLPLLRRLVVQPRTVVLLPLRRGGEGRRGGQAEGKDDGG